MAAEAEAHYTKLMRTELGLRVSEVESLQTTAGRLEHRLNTCVTQRDAALDAAAKLATLGCRHRLVWWTFSRWVRACALKPARMLASRGWVETALLSRELGRVEGISIQSEQLVHAAELHVLSLKEQLACAASPRSPTADPFATDDPETTTTTIPAAAASRETATSDELRESRAAAEESRAAAEANQVVAERLHTQVIDAAGEIDRLNAELSTAREEAALAASAGEAAAALAEKQLAAAREESSDLRATLKAMKIARAETATSSSAAESVYASSVRSSSEKLLENRISRFLVAGDENSAGAGLPGLSVVSRELEALDSISEQITSSIRRKRAAHAAATADCAPAPDGGSGGATEELNRWLHLASGCAPVSPAASTASSAPEATPDKSVTASAEPVLTAVDVSEALAAMGDDVEDEGAVEPALTAVEPTEARRVTWSEQDNIEFEL